ncbi:MAG: PEP-CTERM sorting domain-containing protein [Alphaproteobacteria bacterium]|jgi:hypothetical protein|nr:PEP-CTERM sorting domain-containing protein [Alphaproteobacteria bacterium]
MTFLRTFVAALALAGLATAARAAPVTQPPIDYGGYRLAFVTSTTRDATSTDIGVYNAFVTAAANSVTELAALGTTWKVIASTATVSARENTNTIPGTDGTGIPIYLLDGSTKIADNYADLWNFIDAPLNIDENGNLREVIVHTGSDLFGNPHPAQPLGASVVISGVSDQSDQRWMQYWQQSSTTSLSFYAMSDVLYVAEPATLFLFGVGLAGLAGLRRRRQVR